MSELDFIKTAIADYKVGAIAKSSKYVIERALRRVPGSLNVVVEYGPGDGIMTRALLQRLSPDGILVAVESNEDFARRLRELPDRRLQVVHGTAESARPVLAGLPHIDLIISSIPSTILTPAVRSKIVGEAHDAIAPGGRFVVFHQYTPLMAKVLRERFDNVTVTFEPRNLFPCFIIAGTK